MLDWHADLVAGFRIIFLLFEFLWPQKKFVKFRCLIRKFVSWNIVNFDQMNPLQTTREPKMVSDMLFVRLNF
jgi:hypothetical protein